MIVTHAELAKWLPVNQSAGPTYDLRQVAGGQEFLFTDVPAEMRTRRLLYAVGMDGTGPFDDTHYNFQASITGAVNPTIRTWRHQVLAPNDSGHAIADVAHQHVALLMYEYPEGTDLTANYISRLRVKRKDGADTPPVAWISIARVLAVVNPTPVVAGRLWRPRKKMRNVFGRTHVTSLAANPVFRCDVKINGPMPDGMVDLAALDTRDGNVWLWPGMPTPMPDTAVDWRAPGFAREMVLVAYKGLAGPRGLDSTGAVNTRWRFEEAA